MTPEQLKASILQYAVQGKLVGQKSEEGTAKELFKLIQAEKQKLVKEGKIKKEKHLPEIEEDEIPYNIPDNWIWVRLRDAVFNHGQKKPDKVFSYIDIGSIDNLNQKLNAEEKIIESSKAPSRARKIVKQGDVIYSTVRPYLHNMCIIDKDFSAEPIASTGFAVLSCYEGVYNKYLFYYLLSPIFDSYANSNENAKGAAYPAINDEKLYRAIIPIPPLDEQHRIVDKIEELFPYIDRYADAYEELEQLNEKFPEEIKKSILQYAVQGKLVEQKDEEGSAEELYHQIQIEKQMLIERGNLNKEKTLKEITDNEIPFEIPASWKWCRLAEIVDVRDGTHDSPDYVNEGVPLITSKNLSNGIIDYDNVKYISQDDADKINKRSYVDDNDILFAMIGSIGNPVLVKKDREFCIKNMALFKSFPNTNINMEYLYWLFYFMQYSLRAEATGGLQTFISLKKFREYPVPLPPTEEQRRIVKKIEELLPYCERLS